MKFSRLHDQSMKFAGLFAHRAWRRPAGPVAVIVIGLVAGVLSVLLRAAVSALFGETAGPVVLLPGVVIAALLGGRMGGLIVILLCLAGAGLWAPADIRLRPVEALNFTLVGGLLTLIAASLRRTMDRLDAAATALRSSDARAEDAEQQLHLLGEASPGMLWMSDAEGRCIHLNAAQRRFWNAPRDLSGFNWNETIHPDDVARIHADSQAAVEARTAFFTEGRYRRHDGAWRILRTEAQPRLDADGRYVGLVGVNVDVTEAREAEAALRASERELTAMVDQAAAGIARVALDGVITRTNARFAEILGRREEDVVGLTTAGITHPDDVALTEDMLRTTLGDGGFGQVEKRYLRPDGSVVWALVSLRALRDDSGAATGYIAVIVDITQARAAESARRESEARFRLMADVAPAPIWLTNADAEVEFVNEALARFYGKPRDQMLGHVWRSAMHPDDLDRVAGIQARARGQHLPYDFECRFRRADGEWRWMRVVVSPRFDGFGEFLGYVGMSFDVTETRQALETLEGQDRKHAFLLNLADGLRDLSAPNDIMLVVERALGEHLDALRVGYGEVDPEARVVTMSRDWTAGGGSLEGRFDVDVFGADLISDLLAGQVIRIPDVREDPRTAAVADAFADIGVRALVRVPLIRGGRMRAFLYVHDDAVRHWTEAEVDLIGAIAERTWAEIERARAEAASRESDQRFRAIADTAPVLIWVTGQDRVRTFVNQAYVAYMGGGYETVRTADWRTYIHPEDQDRLLAESITGETTGQPFSLEARYRRFDGEYRWLKSFSRPRLDPEGQLLGFVGVAFDVTEARHAEEGLKRLNELLEERVSEALAEKAKAEADLMRAQRMEAVGQLTGGVAHDFNNLLTVVIGALDIMLRTDNEAKRKRLGQAALAAARRGEGLTHQLLAFSRRQALRPQAVDLNDQIREGEPLLRRAVGEAVDFRLKLRRGGARVHVDPAQFEAALLNLVVNARDAVSDRGRITVETRECKVRPGGGVDLAPGTWICVSVSDNGEGMSPDVVQRVFEPFFTTKAVGKGTGLGLSQVYGFARQSGGDVQITSRPGRGTSIRLYLPPLAAGSAIGGGAAAPVKKGRLGGQTILLVEDDEGVAGIANDILTGLGLKVTIAENGPAALERLEAEPFDLMLTDIVMPGGVTGVELGRIAVERWPRMRVVLTSGYAGEDVDRALAESPWSLLRKPYSGEQLAAALTDALAAPLEA